MPISIFATAMVGEAINDKHPCAFRLRRPGKESYPCIKCCEMFGKKANYSGNRCDCDTNEVD